MGYWRDFADIVHTYLYFLGFVLFILGTVLGFFLRFEPIRELVVDLFPNLVPAGRRSVSGLWESDYLVISQGREVRRRHLIRLKQFGTKVWGTTVVGDEPGGKFDCRMNHNAYLTGTWNNITRGNIYNGAFQFFIAPDGRSMQGKWLGYNRANEIQHGLWAWNLLTSATDRASVRKAMQAFQPARSSPTQVNEEQL